MDQEPLVPATWIKESDKDIVTLTKAYYTKPLTNYNGWTLVNKTYRVGLYEKNNQYIIVCKGTTVTDGKDLFDDLVIGEIVPGRITLDDEVRQMLKTVPQNAEVTLTGHSLGGRAAMTVAAENDVKAVVFNPAAPFNNPLRKGPGVKKATVYQISGDLISSHVDPKAGELIRVNQGYTPLDTAEAHKMNNFSNTAETYSFRSVDQEDVFLHASIAHAVQTVSTKGLPSPMGKVWEVIKSAPLIGSKVERKALDRADIMMLDNKPVAFVSKKADNYSTKIITDQTANLEKDKINKQLQFVSTNIDNEALNSYINTLNSLAGTSIKLSDILYTSEASALTDEEIAKKAKLQSLGVSDEEYSRLVYSGKVNDPVSFLQEAAMAANTVSEELGDLHDARFAKVETEEDLVFSGKQSHKPQSSNGGIASGLYGKYSMAVETTPVDVVNFAGFAKNILGGFF